jgi:hypothetical protein
MVGECKPQLTPYTDTGICDFVCVEARRGMEMEAEQTENELKGP